MHTPSLKETLASQGFLKDAETPGMSQAMVVLLQSKGEVTDPSCLRLPNGTEYALPPLAAGYQEGQAQEHEAQILALCMAIEFAIAFQDHGSGHELQDPEAIACLEKLAFKPESDQVGLGARIQGHLRLELALAAYGRGEVRQALRRCLRSAQRHHKSDGPRGYLDFIHHLLH